MSFVQVQLLIRVRGWWQLCQEEVAQRHKLGTEAAAERDGARQLRVQAQKTL